LLVPLLDVDEEVTLEDLNWSLLEEVESLEPFGAGNPAPVFMLQACAVRHVRHMGNRGKHVRLLGEGFPDFLDAVGFHLRGVTDRALEGQGPVDLAFQVSLNEWQGRRRLQMRLEDVRETG
jgi:single-stranded-DNA-specific exonuclease